MKKFISLLFIFIFSAILFSGCAKVDYSIALFEDGSVQQCLTVELDKADIEAHGYNFEDAKTKIKTEMNSFLTNINQRHLLYCFTKGVSTEDSGIKFGVQEKDVVNIYCYVKFDSTTIYKDFYQIVDNPDDTKVETHIFYNEYYSENPSVYANIEENIYAQNIQAYFSEYSLEDVEYNFTYATSSNKIYSNCDNVTYENGLKIHSWTFNADKLNSRTTRMYQIGINTAPWYVVALIIVFLFLIIGGIVVLFKHFMDKKKLLKVQKINNSIEITQN